MALETVEIAIYDDQVVPQLLDDIVVRVFDSTGTTFITQGTSGDVLPGKVQFTLNGGASPVQYQLRFYIINGAILSPQYIDVYSPASASPTMTNNFRVDAVIFSLPQAIDPHLCRASGFVRGPDGRAKKGIDIHFIPQFNPLVVADQGVLGERTTARTDEDGYISIDLYRNGEYLATVESHENIQREVCVPDRASVNINHLLFPIVVAVDLDPVGPYSLSVGGFLDIVPTLTTSSFTELVPPAAEDAKYTIEDTNIASVEVKSDKITIYGHAPGTTTLNITRKDPSIVYIPDNGITGGSISITVI